MELRPGCDLLQSLEEVLNGILGKLRESAGQEAMKALVSRQNMRKKSIILSQSHILSVNNLAVGQHAPNNGRMWLQGQSIEHIADDGMRWPAGCRRTANTGRIR